MNVDAESTNPAELPPAPAETVTEIIGSFSSIDISALLGGAMTTDDVLPSAYGAEPAVAAQSEPDEANVATPPTAEAAIEEMIETPMADEVVIDIDVEEAMEMEVEPVENAKALLAAVTQSLQPKTEVAAVVEEAVVEEAVVEEAVVEEAVVEEAVVEEAVVEKIVVKAPVAEKPVAEKTVAPAPVIIPVKSHSKPKQEAQVKVVQQAPPKVEATPAKKPKQNVEAPAASKPAVSKPASKPVPSTDVKPAAESTEAENLFTEFDLLPEVHEAIEKRGYKVTTRIQAMSIPHILEGSDVVGQAETGTGKTAAFALPLLSRIDLNLRKPQVLVMAPTRELAIQVAEAFATYGRGLSKLNIATIYGGQSYGIQIEQLKRGAQIVVGTPGRVMDHIRKQLFKLETLKTIVLDEADEMLRMGFAEDMNWVFNQAPQERQTLLFSATLPEAVRKLAGQYLTDPQHIRAKSKTMTADTVSQRVCCVSPREKIATLARILESEVTEGVIVFVKTKEMSTRLAESLCQRGYLASALNGDMQQAQRERTVERLKNGKLDILVATDVAARGLDVERISHVVNYDFPHDAEAYVHRIGRTGRAGREGNAILFLNPKEKYKLRSLEKVTRQSITWMDRPTREVIQAARGTKLMEKVKQAMAKDLSAQKTLVSAFMAEHPEASIEDVAAALASVAIVDKHSEDDDRPGRHDRSNERSLEDRQRGGRGGDFNSRRGDAPRGGKRFERRDDRGRPARSDRSMNASMEKYRIEVGYAHGVRPGNIVGAITSDSGLTGSDIGGIDIQTHFSTVDLPKNLTDEQLRSLRDLRVAGQSLRISKWENGGGSKFSEKPRQFNKKKSGAKPSWKKSRSANAG